MLQYVMSTPVRMPKVDEQMNFKVTVLGACGIIHGCKTQSDRWQI